MAMPSARSRCAHCGKKLKRSTKGGRPKDYCDMVCRRRAQRQRDRERGSSTPRLATWQGVTSDLSARAHLLHSADTTRLPLEEVLDLAERLREDAECATAVAVDAARQAGWAWNEIGTAARMSGATARARWGGVRVLQLLSARVPLSLDEADVDPEQGVRGRPMQPWLAAQDGPAIVRTED